MERVVLAECANHERSCVQHVNKFFLETRMTIVQHMQETRQRFLYEQTDIIEKTKQMALQKAKIERALRHGDRILPEAFKLVEETGALLASMCYVELRPHLPHVHVNTNQKWLDTAPAELDRFDYREVSS